MKEVKSGGAVQHQTPLLAMATLDLSPDGILAGMQHVNPNLN
jgi:hypothetical protein